MNHFNNIFPPMIDYELIDRYRTIDEQYSKVQGNSFIGYYQYALPWLNCPKCKAQPKVWVFDNGSYAACKCGIDKYTHFDVKSESIMCVHRRTGSSKDYNEDNLRKLWNNYCLNYGFLYNIQNKLYEN